MKLSIIAYCYNEEPMIEKLITDFKIIEEELQKKYEVEFIFVDDGSTDKTNQLLHEGIKKFNQARVLKNNTNRGVGGALKHGFSKVKGDLIVTFPGECAFDAKKISELIELMDSQTDIVVGSYHHPKAKIEDVPKLRIWLSAVSTFLYNIILWKKKKRLYTISSGFRVYRKKVLAKVNLEDEGFLANSEMILKSILYGFNVKEHPVTLFGRTKGTTSHMKVTKTIKNHLRFQLKMFIEVYLKRKYD